MWVLPFFVSGVSSCPALAGSMNVCRYPQRVSGRILVVGATPVIGE